MRRTRRNVIGVVGVLAFAASGCGSDPRRVTAADIVPLPPGTAVGSLYAGDYVSTSGRVEACKCRLGSCSTFRFIPGVVISVAQTDGVVEFRGVTSPDTCTGAVDSDGSYRCNGSILESGHVEYVLMDGQFVASNGAPTGMTLTQEISVADPPYDCDLRVSASAQYLGPSAQALGQGHRQRESAWSAVLLGVVAP